MPEPEDATFGGLNRVARDAAYVIADLAYCERQKVIARDFPHGGPRKDDQAVEVGDHPSNAIGILSGNQNLVLRRELVRQ